MKSKNSVLIGYHSYIGVNYKGQTVMN
jgi:hypothetical protein